MTTETESVLEMPPNRPPTPPTDWGHLTPEAIESIKQASREGTRIGTVEGIRDAIQDDRIVHTLVDAVFRAAQDHVTATSGRFLISGLAGLLGKIGWGIVIASAILALGGGWGGVAAFFKAGAVK